MWLDRAATLDKLVGLAEKAAGEGAGLVVFPETFLPGYPDWVWRCTPWDATSDALFGRMQDQAVVVGSQTTDLLGETAARLGVWLCVGVDERDPHGSTLYNTLLYFAPDGTLAGTHRKLMPTGGERLVWGMGDGSTLPRARHRVRPAVGADLLGELHAAGPGRPVRPGRRHLRGADLGRQRLLGRQHAAHRQGGADVRDRGEHRASVAPTFPRTSPVTPSTTAAARTTGCRAATR